MRSKAVEQVISRFPFLIVIVLAAILLAQLVIQNGTVILFPGWIPTGPTRPRGIEAMGQQMLMFAGTILLGHSSLDRVFGYGLKYPDSFKATHLGMIGRKNES